MLTNRSESVAWVEPQFAHLENFSQVFLSYHRNPCPFGFLLPLYGIPSHLANFCWTLQCSKKKKIYIFYIFNFCLSLLCLSTFSEEVENLRSSRVEEGRKPHVPNSRF